jgi:hypothetical protein
MQSQALLFICTFPSLACASRLLWKQDGMNIRKYTSIRNGNLSKQPAQLLIVPHSQLNMTRHNPRFLVVSGSISSQLQHLFGNGKQTSNSREPEQEYMEAPEQEPYPKMTKDSHSQFLQILTRMPPGFMSF